MDPEVEPAEADEEDEGDARGDDRPALPYIEALLLEVLRWSPPLPLGIPHVTTKDDVYNGYFIPKGTGILPNIWYGFLFSCFGLSWSRHSTYIVEGR